MCVVLLICIRCKNVNPFIVLLLFFYLTMDVYNVPQTFLHYGISISFIRNLYMPLHSL